MVDIIERNNIITCYSENYFVIKKLFRLLTVVDLLHKMEVAEYQQETLEFRRKIVNYETIIVRQATGIMLKLT